MNSTILTSSHSTVRSGQNTYLAVFVILAAALTVTGWYQAQTTVGQEESDIIDQTEIDISQANIDNALLFMKTSLGVSATHATDEAAQLSGREQEEDRYRYWLCDGNAQAPETELVRQTASQFTQENMESWLDKLHGKQDQWFYWIGQQECAEVGYRTPMDQSDNDNFLVGINVDGINITHQNGSIVRGDDEVTTSQRVTYNRFWHVHNVAKSWVENEDIEGSVLEQLRQVPDSGESVTHGCGTAECVQDEEFWLPDHPEMIESAVSEGIKNKLDELENNEEYFDDDEVACSFEYKERNGNPYPGWKVTTVLDGQNVDAPACEKTAAGGCGTCLERQSSCTAYTGSDDTTRVTPVQDSPSPPPAGPGGGGGGACGSYCTQWSEDTIKATSAIDLEFEVWADVKVECTDHKFLSVPGETELEPITWRFDLSLNVADRDIDNEFTCPDRHVPCPKVFDREPQQLRTCHVQDETPNVCDSGINTVELTQ